jgi:NAD(P)-dependent dehydrogenase (short-subunit alcohol dehydrogenase family)
VALFVCWAVYPLVLTLLSLGCGLLLERIAGPLPGVLLVPAGLAVVIVVASLLTADAATAKAVAPVTVVLGVLGFVLSARRATRVDWWAAGSALAVFAVFAAPIVLSGSATFAGYITLDDTASFLAMTDRVMGHGRDLAGLAPSTYQRVLDVNLKGEWLCAQAVARRLVAEGKPGAIVNIASIQAGMALPGRTHYAPSKRGVEALTRNLAAELAPHNIRVNCINPGLIATDMTAWVMQDPQILPIILDKIPLHRAGDPDEIAKVAVFLASDDASYVTGQCLYVDGGWIVT